MDSPKQLYPTWALGSSKMPSEENSQEGSGTSQTISEVLTKNLGKLTLDSSIKLPSPLPEYPSQEQGREKKPQGLVERILSSSRRRRTGVRTLLTARKERMARMIRMIQYQRYLSPGPQLQKDLQQKEAEEPPPRHRRSPTPAPPLARPAPAQGEGG
ncbi:PREDICTED: developmental pluripotency-associated protein 3-like [Odobenus rosmarus divergens]|uniref:Developmental pluripotency-associated protein 3-like n=1 Tax=Odobenus rosmarus divergens TaxID=9708 RepID=A0A9B0LVT1_ODORO